MSGEQQVLGSCPVNDTQRGRRMQFLFFAKICSQAAQLFAQTVW